MSDSELTRETYRDCINLMATEVENYLVDFPGDDDVYQFVHEEVEFCEYIIYNGYLTDVIDLADNEPEQWHTWVDDDDSHYDVLRAMAYTAMRQDLIDELHDRGALE